MKCLRSFTAVNMCDVGCETVEWPERTLMAPRIPSLPVHRLTCQGDCGDYSFWNIVTRDDGQHS